MRLDYVVNLKWLLWTHYIFCLISVGYSNFQLPTLISLLFEVTHYDFQREQLVGVLLSVCLNGNSYS